MRVVPPPESRSVALDSGDRMCSRESMLEAIGSRVIEAFGFVTDALLQLLGLLGDAVEPLLAFVVAVASVRRGDIVDEKVQSALVTRVVLEEEAKVDDGQDAVTSNVACTAVEDEVDAEEDGFPIQDAAEDDENDVTTVRSSTCGEVGDQEAIIATIAVSEEDLSMAPADDTRVTAGPTPFPGFIFMDVVFDLEKLADARDTRPSRRVRALNDPFVLEGMKLVPNSVKVSQSNVSASMSAWCVTAAKCRCSCAMTECIVAMDVADGWRDYADMHAAAEFRRDSINETKLQQLVAAVAMFNETLRLDASTIAFMARDLEQVGNGVDAALIRISTMSTTAIVPPSPQV